MQEEYGLQVLAEGENATHDIVFVHGLSGNRESTWTKGDVFWPQSLLARDIPHARILTVGYSPTVESFDIEHELLESTIESHAVDICEKLGRLRDDTKTAGRPIMFVAHSLGGFTCAKILIAGSRDSSNCSDNLVAKATHSMVFLATPIGPSSAKEWPRLLTRIIDTAPFMNSSDVVVHCEDDENSISNESVFQRFRLAFHEALHKTRTGKSLQIVSFYEQLQDRDQVVSSSAAFLPGFELLPIEANHHNISRFEGREENYKILIAAIRQLMEEGTGTIPSKIAFDAIRGGSAYGGSVGFADRTLNIAGGTSRGGAVISFGDAHYLGRSFVVASPEVREVCKAFTLLRDRLLKHSSILRRGPGLRDDQKWRTSSLMISRNPSSTWLIGLNADSESNCRYWMTSRKRRFLSYQTWQHELGPDVTRS